MKYSMTQVENLTGIKSHTLRIWERRYNFLKPARTQSNIRFYSEEQLKMLLNIDTLSRNGYRISKIAMMTADEINNHVVELMSLSSEETKDDINALVLSMLRMNERDFDSIFKKRVMRNGLLHAVKELIYPFLNHIGVLWGTDKAIPAQEHFISNLIRQKIITAIEMIPLPTEEAPKILFFLPENEDHEIGLLLSSFIAKDLGWGVYYLGQNVPTSNIEDAIHIVQPQIIMTMMITPRREKDLHAIYSIVKHLNIPMLVAGNPVNFPDEKANPNLVFILNPDHFINYLNAKKKD